MAAKPCPGCLGSHECWVCLGTGMTEDKACARCGGSGTCPDCGMAATG